MKIDKGVPLPSDARRRDFPFATLAVGDSFWISAAEIGEGNIRSSASHAGRALSRKFTVRREGDGYRTWRVA